MNTTAVLYVKGLSKSFGKKKVLDDVNFEVPPGSIFGLLGLNGAGKTTVIRIVLGLLRSDGGCATVFGEDSRFLSRGTRQRIGYLSEDGVPHSELPFPYLVRYLSAFFPKWDHERARELAERFRIPAGLPLDDMSPGERRRAELALVLCQSPDLLILDDPVVGLDVTVRREFLWAALEAAREEGKTVVFTSHVLSDVERIADSVGIIDCGIVRVTGELDAIKERTRRLVIPLADGVTPESIVIPGETSREFRSRELVVVTGSYSDSLGDQLNARFGDCGVERLNLEDIFCACVDQAASAGEGAVS